MNEDPIRMYEIYREDRVRQVKTTKERHGADFFSKNGVKGGKAVSKTRDKNFYRLMALKRFHPERFDEQNNYLGDPNETQST